MSLYKYFKNIGRNLALSNSGAIATTSKGHVSDETLLDEGVLQDVTQSEKDDPEIKESLLRKKLRKR